MLGINPPGAGAAKGAGGAVHLPPSVQHHPCAPVSPRTRLVHRVLPGPGYAKRCAEATTALPLPSEDSSSPKA